MANYTLRHAIPIAWVADLQAMQTALVDIYGERNFAVRVQGPDYMVTTVVPQPRDLAASLARRLVVVRPLRRLAPAPLPAPPPQTGGDELAGGQTEKG
ncbi:hypothetical protein ACJ41O_005524 [Fusarium nematophilum]